MSCVYPIDAWRSAKCNESGKRGIVFNPRDGFIDQPLQVPCGKCIGCAGDRSRVWAVRMHHEASLHVQNCFVTLTYGDPCPSVIDKRDVQLFIKRLRRLCKVRYFCTGEYGTISRRPHYHAVIFGADFRGGAYSVNDSLYSNPYIDRAWGKGFVSIGDVTIESCMYVAGYCNKKLADNDTFNLMSRRPGIGHSWLDKYRSDLVRNGKAVVNGREFPIPKKYLEWYEDDFDDIKRERRQYMHDLTPDQIWRKRQKLRDKEANFRGKADLLRGVV